ncbi:MAG: transposase domain-containing protein [Rhodospirillales bacterium]|nr:transposase domain-containing protein [Rhodospirillales bacterium]
MSRVEPYRRLGDVIIRIVDGHPNSRLDELLPWRTSFRSWSG